MSILAATVSLLPLVAQTEQRQATVRGGGGDEGKCTIEVRVDGAAEVEIRGDRGILRTISGQPARWVRFECNGVMPANPANFEFKGVDGRGRQILLSDPRNNRGVAVIGLEDRDGGSEGYTFDIEWEGGSDFSNQPRWGGNDRYAGGETLDACENAVRDRAYSQFGSRDVRILETDSTGGLGRRESVSGTLEVRDGNRRGSYRFSCMVNANNGRVRSVEITPAYENQGSYFPSAGSGSYSDDACRQGIEQRLRRDGYRNVRVDSLSFEGRRGRNERVTGRATAQSGGDLHEFSVACSLNNNGSVTAVDVIRQ